MRKSLLSWGATALLTLITSCATQSPIGDDRSPAGRAIPPPNAYARNQNIRDPRLQDSRYRDNRYQDNRYNDRRYNDNRYVDNRNRNSRNRNDRYYDERNLNQKNQKKQKKPTKQTHVAEKGPEKPKALGKGIGGCELDAIAGLSIAGSVGVLEVVPRLLKQGTLTGQPETVTLSDSYGRMVQTMVVDLRGDRALLAPYLSANSEMAEEMGEAMSSSLSGPDELESSFRPQYSTSASVQAVHSALSFINGNYTTVKISAKLTGHRIAAILAAIMETIDYPGCSEYFIAEAGKVMNPAHAAYLRDFPFKKIRELRKSNRAGQEFDRLHKARKEFEGQVKEADDLLADKERYSGDRLSILKKQISMEVDKLKIALKDVKPCQMSLMNEIAFFNPTKSEVKNTELWVKRCREAIDDRDRVISASLLNNAAEIEVLAQLNVLLEEDKLKKTDPGAQKVVQTKIEKNIAKSERLATRSKDLEAEQATLKIYRDRVPIRGQASSINGYLDEIRRLTDQKKEIESGKVFNEDHKGLRQLHRDLTAVNRDYLSVGIFGGAAQSEVRHDQDSDDE
jgi:hypothetical protein